MMRRRMLPAVALAAAVIGLSLSLLAPKPSEAMPPFAQANGIDCSACHVMVPLLNAYGRYIQTTQFSALSHEAESKVSPIWATYSIRGKSTRRLDSTQPNKTITYGNLSLDAIGFAGPQFTYRVEQSIFRSDQTGGGLSRFWLAYSGFFGGDGHLAIGKLEPPIPSMFINSADMTGYTTPGMAVGRHSWKLSSTRWGATFNYQKGDVAAAAGWLVGNSNLIGASDFSIAPGTDRALEYRVSYASPKQPLEFGVYGASGSYVLTGVSNLDRYTALGGYAERDPGPHYIPGIQAFYETNHDDNPGVVGAGGTTSHGGAVELYEPFFKDNMVLIGAREEMTDNGLGTTQHYTIADLSVRIPHLPYLFLHGEAAMGHYTSAPNGIPTWQWSLQWFGPIQGPLTKIAP